jgi:hypothetical protein
MPKTASEIYNKKLYASDSVRAIEQRVNQTWMHTSVVNPNRSILINLFEGFCGLVENDPNLIENGLEKLENFNEFLTEPQNDGRTGFDILTDGLSKADTETFFIDLRRFNRDLDWGLDMEKIEEIKNEKVASIVDEKISNSSQYNKFYDEIKVFTNLAEKIIEAKKIIRPICLLAVSTQTHVKDCPSMPKTE